MEWRQINDFPGCEVSNYGEIRCNGNVKKSTSHSEGYRVIGLKNKDGNRSVRFVHRIVAEAFILNPDNKPLVDHINSDRSDNRLENLRWTTYSENSVNIPTRVKDRYIYPNATNTSFHVKIMRNRTFVVDKRFSTREEAIKYRDQYLNTTTDPQGPPPDAQSQSGQDEVHVKLAIESKTRKSLV